jgi:hypothetical protein
MLPQAEPSHRPVAVRDLSSPDQDYDSGSKTGFRIGERGSKATRPGGEPHG